MPEPTDKGNDGGASQSRGTGPTDEGRGVARNLLRRFRGKAEDALAHLADENKEMRVERRDLRDKLKSFEGPDVVVLKGDDLKAFNDYKALGKPDDLKKSLEDLPTLREKVSVHDRRTSAMQAAELLGWNPEATAGMIVDKALQVTLVDGQDKDGKAIKIPHVRPANDAKAATVPLAEWQKNNAGYLAPALAAKAGTGAQSSSSTQSSTSTTQSGQRAGTQFVEQRQGSDTAPSGSAAKAIPGRQTYRTPGQRAAAGGNK